MATLQWIGSYAIMPVYPVWILTQLVIVTPICYSIEYVYSSGFLTMLAQIELHLMMYDFISDNAAAFNFKTTHSLRYEKWPTTYQASYHLFIIKTLIYAYNNIHVMM